PVTLMAEHRFELETLSFLPRRAHWILKYQEDLIWAHGYRRVRFGRRSRKPPLVRSMGAYTLSLLGSSEQCEVTSGCFTVTSLTPDVALELPFLDESGCHTRQSVVC